MTVRSPAAPNSEAELIARAHAIAGLTLGELAARFERRVPEQPRHAKGWAGQLVELALGATAGSRAEPDFQAIGIELKTLPVTAAGQPAESTYVCTAALVHERAPAWDDSLVRHKLDRVLWLPVESAPERPIGDRRIGMGLLWTPSPEQADLLRADWEEFMDLICLGRVEEITAHHGQCLQIRPKAADASARRRGIDAAGEVMRTLPRGFYLRSTFTADILAGAYATP